MKKISIQFIIVFIFSFLISFYNHREEITANNTIYGDTGFYYLIDGINNPFKIQNDPILKSFGKDIGVKKYLIFNPLSLISLQIFNKLTSNTSKSLILFSFIIQIIAFFVFVKLSKIIFKNFNFWENLLVAVFLSMFFSTSDVFFGVLHREAGFVFSLLTYMFFITERTCPFLISSFFYAVLYSVSLPFILTLNLFYFTFIKNKIKKTLSISVLAISAILSYIILRSSYFYDKLISVRNGFEWKKYSNGFNFLSRYFLNLNEYSELYIYFIYFLLLILLLCIIISINKKAIKKLINKNEAVLASAIVVSFLISGIVISFPVASREGIFLIPLLISLLALKGISNISKKPVYSLILINILFAIPFTFLREKATGFHSVDKEIVNYILSNTDKNSIMFTHPANDILHLLTSRLPYYYFEMETFGCAINKDVCSKIMERFETSVDIYYTDSIDKIIKFVKNNNIGIIVVETKYYDTSYFNFNDDINSKIIIRSWKSYSGNIKKRFALLELAKKYGNILNDTDFIIDTKKLYNYYDEKI
ncbi:MAG: hypothetical protein KA059_03080 [Elusimicrobiales bacterium]|nr:hypothetical protein [Elusimicrobiales bacterium]